MWESFFGFKKTPFSDSPLTRPSPHLAATVELRFQFRYAAKISGSVC